MFKDIILSVIRSLLIAGGTAAAARGVLQGGDVELLAGAGVTLAAGVWGAVDKVLAERKAQRRENIAAVVAANDTAAELANAPRVDVWTEQQRNAAPGG